MTIRALFATTVLLALSGVVLPAAAQPVPTARDAMEFVTNAEIELGPLNEYNARVAWIGSNFITEDTMWLRAKARSEMSQVQIANALKAATFNNVAVDPVTRRKLDILKRHLTLPAPRGRVTAQQVSKLAVNISSLYATGKVRYSSRDLTLD